ncbi:hypothetical protein G4G28_04545 [Massilia sp. Dwa41.01b]|uniref:hypothetical protein n=1 Tax=unclassified Massilia TaxID=2609279 RepID=UPI0015FFCC36|nr:MULTISPECIES: hypothetical protein [unclassified Massilia]QNA87919.1 hypothetical protein G4G28_04545 [Massilia sp. Dwa41.01b]QNA98822.1 hypothetical protein G4G31_08265 [Massilia sp. Se16.2.3]
MRILVLALALLLTLGALYLTVFGSNALLDIFSALTDRQQRLASGAMCALTALLLSVGGWLRYRKAGPAGHGQG